MKKRGQFFLLAALIIVAILASLVTVYNVAQTKSDSSAVYYLSNEIDFESSQVIDQGVFYGSSQEDIFINIESLADSYAASNPGSNLAIAYGDSSTMYVLIYTSDETGSVGLDLGNGAQEITVTEPNKQKFLLPSLGTDPVTIQISEDVSYQFELNPGQNFYVVLKETSIDEEYVSTG